MLGAFSIATRPMPEHVFSLHACSADPADLRAPDHAHNKSVVGGRIEQLPSATAGHFCTTPTHCCYLISLHTSL